MKKIITTFVLLVVMNTAYATEARIESMGSNSDFVKDDISVFVNPATCFEHGNMLVGALGQFSKINNNWQRSDEWFGGWAIYPMASGMKVALGATLNRTTETEKQLKQLDENNFFTVSVLDMDSTPAAVNRMRIYGNQRTDYLESVGEVDPVGKVYLFGGVEMGDNAFAVGLRYAGASNDSGAKDLSSVSIFGANFGFTGKMDQHLIEAGINVTNLGITRTSSVLKMNLDESYQSFKVLLRDYFTINDRLALVPVVTLDKINVLGIDNTDLGIGVGFNRVLHKGLTWAGFKYAYHTASFPDKIDDKSIYFFSSDNQVL
ncbi:MAG: hypothetical protein JNL74_20990, partial [Fibrobacteres bacterium]|nr:hypothetical protein [Fibrobacterota bacterium]